MWPSITIALAFTIWGLWVRRRTWAYMWERSGSFHLALMAAAIILSSPVCCLGGIIHTLTGWHNFDVFLAHVCAIAAGCALVHTVLSRLGDDEDLAYRMKQHIERPMTLIIPAMFVLFINGSNEFRPSFYDVPVGLHLAGYWLLVCGTVAYLFGYSFRGFMVLRREPGTQRCINVYLFSCACGIAACVALAAAITVPWKGVIFPFMWLISGLSVVGFAVASAQSWAVRLRRVHNRLTDGRSTQPLV